MALPTPSKIHTFTFQNRIFQVVLEFHLQIHEMYTEGQSAGIERFGLWSKLARGRWSCLDSTQLLVFYYCGIRYDVA